jgi:hypothetical protein
MPQNIQSPLCEQYFADHRADFYQANAYDVYARAMHDAGLNEYFYAFDDVAGQSGTEAAAWSPSLNVTISLGNFTNSQETRQQTPPAIESHPFQSWSHSHHLRVRALPTPPQT